MKEALWGASRRLQRRQRWGVAVGSEGLLLSKGGRIVRGPCEATERGKPADRSHRWRQVANRLLLLLSEHLLLRVRNLLLLLLPIVTAAEWLLLRRRRIRLLLRWRIVLLLQLLRRRIVLLLLLLRWWQASLLVVYDGWGQDAVGRTECSMVEAFHPEGSTEGNLYVYVPLK